MWGQPTLHGVVPFGHGWPVVPGSEGEHAHVLPCPGPAHSFVGAQDVEGSGEHVGHQGIGGHHGHAAPRRRRAAGAGIQDVAQPLALHLDSALGEAAGGHRSVVEGELQGGLGPLPGMGDVHRPGLGAGGTYGQELATQVQEGPANAVGPEDPGGLPEPRALSEAAAVQPGRGGVAGDGGGCSRSRRDRIIRWREAHCEAGGPGGGQGGGQGRGVGAASFAPEVPGVHQGAHGGLEGPVRPAGPRLHLPEEGTELGTRPDRLAHRSRVHRGEGSGGAPGAEERLHLLHRPERRLAGILGRHPPARLHPEAEAGAHHVRRARYFFGGTGGAHFDFSPGGGVGRPVGPGRPDGEGQGEEEGEKWGAHGSRDSGDLVAVETRSQLVTTVPYLPRRVNGRRGYVGGGRSPR